LASLSPGGDHGEGAAVRICERGVQLKANANRHKAMSYERIVQPERELRTQIEALLARTADEAEKNAPEVDIPAEIARRAAHGVRRDWRRSLRRASALSSVSARRMQHGREAGDESNDCRPRGGRFKRDFGIPKDRAQ